MANDLDDVVRITLTNQSQAVATESFEIPAILATFTNFSERARTYANIEEVGEDFAATSKVYIMASKLFGQSTVIGAVPPSLVVGRRQVDSVVFTPTVVDNTAYTVTLNGTPYVFTSGTGATATTIVTGLKAAIGTPTGITVGGTATLSLAPTVQGTDWSVTASTNLVGVNTSTETIVDSLEELEQENDTWYLIETDSHIAAEVEALSDAIQARRKIFGTSSQDVVGLKSNCHLFKLQII